jgi:ligand-binding sensor protein
MEMTDLLPRKEWAELERTIHDRYGLNARVYDAKGFSFTGYTTWCNRLCPVLKSVPAALSAICSVAHQAMAAQARVERESVIDACDIGLLKICVPVIVGDEFVGVVGGCGLLLDDEEVDTFFLGKATGLDEETVEEMACGIGIMTAEKAQELSLFLEDRIREIVHGYEQRRSGPENEVSLNG